MIMTEVNNLTDVSLSGKAIRKTADFVLKREKAAGKDLSVALVGQKRIKELNKKYRGKNSPTDVLSFKLAEGLGEVVICPQEVKKNAEKSGQSFKKELNRVLIHGIFHLLGYDHEKSQKEAVKMEKKQEYFLGQLK
jgi:probable rRNA maturation factor